MTARLETDLRRRLLLQGLMGGAAATAAPWPLGASTAAVDSTGTDADRALYALFERSFQRRLEADPLLRAAVGLGADDAWNDVSRDAAEARGERIRAERAQAQEIAARGISPSAADDFELFRFECDAALRRLRWRTNHYPVCHMRGPQRIIPQTLIDRHPVSSVADAEAYIERLRGVEMYLSDVVQDLEERRSQGVMPPHFTYAPVIETCRRLISGAPFDGGGDSALWQDFRGKVARLGSAHERRLLEGARDALLGPFARGFHQLIGWLDGARLRMRSADGVWALPDGDAYYASALATETTLDVDADSVHRKGLEEVQRIHGLMRDGMARMGHRGSLQAFLGKLENDPASYYPNTDAGRNDYLERARRYMRDVEARLPEITGLRAVGDLEVRRLEPWLEVSAGIAGYFPPSDDGSRPGMVVYNQRDMANLPVYEIQSLAYHEGIPGHHLERGVARSLTRLPDFRRLGSYTAFSEGWALYAEQVPAELGLYEDPLQDFGRLTSELMRAGRLVVDTGLHALRWTPAQAMQWLESNTAGGREGHRIAIERYLVTPAQAASYQLGKLELLALRERAQAALGGRFRLPGFHDAVLGNGPLPMPLLARQLDEWIRRSRGGAGLAAEQEGKAP